MTATGALVISIAVLQAGSRTAPRAPETYESADVDPDGNLRIVTTAHRTIVVPKGGTAAAGEVFGKQRSYEEPVISDDHRAVGAQALYANCCTSYDIPLQLVIYSQGRTHRFNGAENLAIFSWHFVDSGRRVAFGATTVHFGCAVFWELRDVATERLVAEAEVPEPCGQIPDPPEVKIPKWVEGAVSGIR